MLANKLPMPRALDKAVPKGLGVVCGKEGVPTPPDSPVSAVPNLSNLPYGSSALACSA
jgi:hypothetical protein